MQSGDQVLGFGSASANGCKEAWCGLKSAILRIKSTSKLLKCTLIMNIIEELPNLIVYHNPKASYLRLSILAQSAMEEN